MPATPMIDQWSIRPTWLEIDCQGVVSNYNRAKERVGSGVAVFPVVKADAYGLGAVPISRALKAAGAPGLCVGLVEEGATLRKAGIDGPMVLFAGLTPGSEESILDHDLTPFLYDLVQARSLSRFAQSRQRRVGCYVKVDTGMGRIGFPAPELARAVAVIQALPGLRLLGIVSHLAWGDEEPSATVSAGQISQMQTLLAQPEIERISKAHHSLANSAGILYHSRSHLDWVRPGIMLYGASPAHPRRHAQEEGLVAVVRWLSRIIQVRTVEAGTPLGYGHSHICRKKTIIAQIPVGYGDGYNRLLSNRGAVLIHGKRASVLGRVCMDLTSIDITEIPEARTGSLVTLLGADRTDFIGIEQMAGWMQTIPYEVICNLGKRLARRYL
ncbi:MAG: alanine racemase [Magnetococcales bacterium]|nr:alanine racemase [Magnetococcales bacterium]